MEWLIVLALFVQVLLFLNTAGMKAGIDFYQYWGVGHVIRLTEGEVRNPYTEHRIFNEILAEDARRSSDPLYKKVQKVRRDLEFQGSPMAYTFFSFTPPLSYTSILRLYFILQCFLFLFVVYQLSRFATANRFQSILAALTLTLVFQPLKSELTVGNMNTLVMFILFIALVLAKALAKHDDRRAQHRPKSTVFLATSLLVLMGTVSMLKPTVALMGFTLFLFLLARFGLTGIWPALPVATVALAAIAYLPALRLGSATIWLDWREYFEHGNLDMFDLPIAKGNFSTALFFSKYLDLPLASVTLLIASILTISIVWAARNSGNARRALRNSFSDPLVSLSFGLAVFYAISPLVWYHYYLLILIPGIAFFHPRYKSTLVPIFMIASVLLASSLLLQIAWYARSILQFESTNQPEFISYWIMSSWIPLWLGLLNIVSTCDSRLIDPATICSGPSPSVDFEAIKNDETCISSNDTGRSAGQ